MQVLRRAGLAAAVALAVAALPATAQFYHWDANVNGGWNTTTKALDNTTAFGTIVDNNNLITNNVLNGGGDLSFGNGGIVGGQVGYWFIPNLGVRANFAYAGNDFKQSGGNDLIDNMNLWSGTGDVMVRFIKPRKRFTKTEILPYVALGAGAQWINPPGDRFLALDQLLIDTIPTVGQLTGRSGVPIFCVAGLCQGPDSPGFIGFPSNVATQAFFVKEASTFAGLVGVGTDVRLTKNFAVRLEAGDRIWKAPIYNAAQVDGTTLVVLGDKVGNTVHQFYFTGGLNALLGLVPPPPAPVATLPAPPPPPPPPPPATERVMVCVVDPMAPGGLKMIEATRNLSTGDTTVMQNGERVPLSQAVTNVPTAATADWYMQGRPLEIGTGTNRIRYVSFGGARVIEPTDLGFLGTVNGLPVYADRTTLGVVEGLTPGTDLSMAVDQRPMLRQALQQKVQVAYVPLSATGCVFQPLQLQAEVRKGK
ncbi:MAG TPA: hypothetical protein VFQ38_23795 [Longimicrobiales bacterium]|nr:hypothetical protein [Longimicrobiales bacterium]